MISGKILGIITIKVRTSSVKKNFQLTHSQEDNQDILYNMSSGQLGAVSLSFLLCMHQVYAKYQSLSVLPIDNHAGHRHVAGTGWRPERHVFLLTSPLNKLKFAQVPL